MAVVVRHGATRHVSLDVAVGGDLLPGFAALHLCLEESMRTNCLRGARARASLPPARLPAAGLSISLARKKKVRLSPTARHSCSGITGFWKTNRGLFILILLKTDQSCQISKLIYVSVNLVPSRLQKHH
jgi:hypothetical protein